MPYEGLSDDELIDALENAGRMPDLDLIRMSEGRGLRRRRVQWRRRDDD